MKFGKNSTALVSLSHTLGTRTEFIGRTQRTPRDTRNRADLVINASILFLKTGDFWPILGPCSFHTAGIFSLVQDLIRFIL